MMSDRHFQGNGIRLRAPEPEDLEVMFRFEDLSIRRCICRMSAFPGRMRRSFSATS